MAVAAAMISVVALAFSVRNRRSDLDRSEAAIVRARTWEILDRDAGMRTANSLLKPDGQSIDAPNR